MDKHSLLNIDVSVLKEYAAIEALNPNNWDITSYLHLKYDMNAALAFSKLYFPDFIERKGCIILSHRFDEKIFEEWFVQLNGDIKAIESICNSYEVMDYFEANRPTDMSLDLYNQVIDQFANALKISWEINCKILFPNREIVVEVYDEYDTIRITLYQNK